MNKLLPKCLPIILVLLSTLLSLTVYGNPIIPIPTQPLTIFTPSPPVINAKAYILIDIDSGKVLAENNADVRMPPASLTKLMSLYIVSSALKNGSIHYDDKARISTKA